MSTADDSKSGTGDAPKRRRKRSTKTGTKRPEPSLGARLKRAQSLGAQAFGQGKDVATDAKALMQTLNRGASEVRHVLHEQAEARPYVLVGSAAVAGYVLGRGLPVSLTRTLIGLGGRMAVSALLRRLTQQASL